MTIPRSRYPGLRPFGPEEEANFFGRTEEIEAVCRLLDLDRLIILHGPSGMGKSSLINAGILPMLSNVRRWEIPYQVVKVRFTNYDPALARMRHSGQVPNRDSELIKDPVDRFIEACLGPDPDWPEDLLPLPKPSLWLCTKQLIIDQEIEPLRIIFVLDQFEELFTYPEERVHEFARQLEELYHQVQPESISRGVERKRLLETEQITEPDSERTRTLFERIDTPLDVKFLISMRSDKLHFLERLKPYLPEMMLNSYELRSFDQEQARRAIMEPASLADEGFMSPPFTISEEALAGIIDFLEDKLTRRIEPAQLQIICQHMEQQMVARARQKR